MRPGQSTMWWSNGPALRSSTARPRTEMPASCTVLGSPDTSGCHHAEVLALGKASISTRGWQPVDRAHFGRRQRDAIRHTAAAVRIVAALAAVQIQQSARDVGKRQRAGVVVAQFVQAAAAATVAQRFPLFAGHLLQCLGLPERRRRSHGERRLPGGGVSCQGSPASRAGGSSTVRVMNRRSVANENQMRRLLRIFWPITASLKDCPPPSAGSFLASTTTDTSCSVSGPICMV